MHQCIKFVLFCNDTLHVSDGLSVHHQEFKTVHTATGLCQTDNAVADSSICLTLHVSDGLSVHHQEFKTVHTATGICQTDTAVADGSICLTNTCCCVYVLELLMVDGKAVRNM